MFHVPQKVVVMFSISYLVYSINYIVLGTLLQCKLPCVLTNNNKDQSEWRIYLVNHSVAKGCLLIIISLSDSIINQFHFQYLNRETKMA